MNLYPWLLWLHVLFSFIFFFAHGTAMGIAFRLPLEKNPERMKALLDITGMTMMPFGIGMLGLGAFAMAVMSGWWKFGWWWLSIPLMFGLASWMTWYGRKIYGPIRRALGLPYMTGFSKEDPAEPPASLGEVERLVARSNPRLQAWVGLIVVALLLWLMKFKPF